MIIIQGNAISMYQLLNYTTIHVDLVFRGLFVCEFAYSQNGLKCQISSQNVPYPRSKIAELVYRE